MRISDWSSDVCSSDLFGERLSSRQSIQFLLARMRARVHTSRLAWLHAARLRDAGERFKEEAAIAKLVAGEAAMDNARDATQVFAIGRATVRERVGQYG